LNALGEKPTISKARNGRWRRSEGRGGGVSRLRLVLGSWEGIAVTYRWENLRAKDKAVRGSRRRHSQKVFFKILKRD